MELSERRKSFFLNFLIHFCDLHQILNILLKNMMVIVNIFLKLQTAKNFVNVCQVLAKSPWERFYHVFSLYWGELIWKMSPLVVGEILGKFAITLTSDGKYHVQDWEILPLPIQMQISRKHKTFSDSFFPFLESISNFKHFETKR